MPLVLKGILAPDDARRRSSRRGASVSRRMAAASSTARSRARGARADRRRGRGAGEVWVDGGIRRGTDVPPRSRSARPVFTARPFLYALACAGEAGVAHGLAIMRDELERGLALLGVRSPGEVTRAHVQAPR